MEQPIREDFANLCSFLSNCLFLHASNELEEVCMHATRVHSRALLCTEDNQLLFFLSSQFVLERSLYHSGCSISHFTFYISGELRWRRMKNWDGCRICRLRILDLASQWLQKAASCKASSAESDFISIDFTIYFWFCQK